MKTPLAWLQLTHEKAKLLIALAGISFADMLMFVQLGFQGALFDANLRLSRNLKGDIVLLSTQSEAIFILNSFSRRSLYQALGMKEVASVSPLYINMAVWKNPVEGNIRQIMVIGFNPQESILNVPGLDRKNRRQIQLTDVVLFDDKSRAEFGPIAELYQQGNRVTAEIGQRRIRIGGLFTLGASFTADGNIITSDLNFWRLFPDRPPGLIDVGLITLKPEIDIDKAIARLEQKLPEDIQVLSKEEFIEMERTYWQEYTAIGFIFALGTTIGFIVGTVIVYQILYTDVAEHLPEYATLKAMGYKDKYFVVVVLQEAVILALLGYLPGYAISSVVYVLAAGATNLPIMMTLERAITVLILTIIMCCLSGTFALRKLAAADPADIF
jgi:putative ABC transport system permease protein